MAIFDQNKVPENYTKNWPATCKKKFLAAMIPDSPKVESLSSCNLSFFGAGRAVQE